MDILNVLSGGAETTTSIRSHEAWDLAQRLSPAWVERFNQVFDENRKLRAAVYEFTYQTTTAELLERIAGDIDCGDDCDHGHTEHDTNAFVCSRAESAEGCASFDASQLREFAAAIRTRAGLSVEPSEPQPQDQQVPQPIREETK
jgi:hypothetical protein